MTNIFSLEGKNAWITGAAYGIGFSIAQAFVEAGAKTIIFNVRGEEALQKALASYREAGITNVTFKTEEIMLEPVAGSSNALPLP